MKKIINYLVIILAVVGIYYEFFYEDTTIYEDEYYVLDNDCYYSRDADHRVALANYYEYLEKKDKKSKVLHMEIDGKIAKGGQDDKPMMPYIVEDDVVVLLHLSMPYVTSAKCLKPKEN